MKRIILIILLLFSFSFVYADELVNEYIEFIEKGDLIEVDLESFKNTYDDEALEMFLTAHDALTRYEYMLAYDLLENVLEVSNSDALKIEVLFYLSEIDRIFEDYPRMILRGIDLKELSHENNDLLGIIRADYILSRGYLTQLDYVEAENYAKEALNLSESIGHSYGIWQYKIIMGDVALYQDDFDTALETFKEAKLILSEGAFENFFEDSYVYNERLIAFALFRQYKIDAATALLEPLLDRIPEENFLSRSKVFKDLGRSSLRYTDKQGFFEQALNLYDLVSKIGDNDDYKNRIHRQLAYSYYIVGEYKKSADNYYEAEVFEGTDSSENLETSIIDLENYKYNEVTERINLLEEVAQLKSDELVAQKRTMFFAIISIALIIVVALIILFVVRIRRQTKEALYLNSVTDTLTSVYNRSKIIEIFESKLEGDNALILLDMDHLKEINDQFGHSTGDKVLKTVADTLQHSVRGDDVVGRYGGGEFLVILDFASQDDCRIVAERIRSNIEEIVWDEEGLKTTCSVAVTRVYSKDADEVLLYVDSLLGQAKENGRNQVVYG